MSLYNRVAWTDGMFLMPQHFQQAERQSGHELSLRLTQAFPQIWGILDLRIDDLAISQGRLEVLRCRAVFPDGSTVDAPTVDPLPSARTFKLAPEAPALEVFLSLPIQNKRAPLSAPTGDRADVRYVRKVEETPDEHEPARAQPVEVLVPNLRLVLGGESHDGLVILKIAEIRRGKDGPPELNREVVPPLMRVRASSFLEEQVKDLLGETISRARSLAEKQKHFGKGVIEFTSTDILGFWFLHTLNLQIPPIKDLLEQVGTHPATLYRELLRLAGGLTTFDQRHAADLPSYDHERIAGCYLDLLGRIRVMLRRLFVSPYEILPFEKQKEFWMGEVTDQELLTQGRFVLVVTADMNVQQIVEQFPKGCKISEVREIEELVAMHVGGVRISHLPNPPTALPSVEGACYFYVQTTGPEWDKIKATGKIAAYVPNWLPNVNIKLVGIRPRRGA